MNPHVPTDLATKIFEKELELETNCSLEVLNTLMGYYKDVIEYYEETGNTKYSHYQQRLQKILIKPNVLKMMQDDNPQQKIPKKPQLARRNTDVKPIFTPKPSHKSHTMSALSERSSNDPTHQKIVTRMVENQHKRTESVTSRAVTDIYSQETSLKERLTNRKQKVLNTSNDSSFFFRSFKKSPTTSFLDDSVSTQFFLEIESDKSAGSSVAQMHERAEKIIEESFNEKTEMISEIKIKYQAQISELELEGDICAEVVKELKKSMNAEIEEVTKTLTGKRKQLLKELKSEFMLTNCL